MCKLPDEVINMFALRLEQLTCKKYPGVDARAHNSLRAAFLLHLPKSVETKLWEYCVQTEVITGKKVPCPLGQLVNLADCYDEDHNQNKSGETITNKNKNHNNLECRFYNTMMILMLFKLILSIFRNPLARKKLK